MSSEVSTEGVSRFVDRLDRHWLEQAPSTYLPTILPLAFPTTVHTINFFTTLHLIYDTLASPDHAAYFHETGSSARDTAIRGTVSLFLASEEAWIADNLLSADAWRRGKLDERAVAEHFEIQVVRERQHETMQAIRVGERWDLAVGVAQSLVKLFEGVGQRLNARCAGEAVEGLVKESKEAAGDDTRVWVAALAEQAAQLVPGLTPSAPLHLLHDLAQRQFEAQDLDLDLPAPADLSDITPLPLSTPALLRTGIISLSAIDQRENVAYIEPFVQSEIDPLASTEAGSTSPKLVKVSRATSDRLNQLSISAAIAIKEECGRRGEAGDKEWKTKLSYYDIWRVCQFVEDSMSKQGQGFAIATS